MIVCIAEKPSVARDIAHILGANQAKNGYMEGNGYQVTWTFGHLCELKEPNDYQENWKHWSLGALPMINYLQPLSRLSTVAMRDKRANSFNVGSCKRLTSNAP